MLPLGKILGIRIGVDLSWFIVFFVMTKLLSDGLHQDHAEWAEATVWITAASACLMFFASILLHELGHSIMAKLLHVQVKSITLFLFGGAAELGSEPKRSRDEFLIAIAGPAVSALLAGGFATLLFGFESGSPIFVVARWLAVINFGVAGFNMLPAFPLDGGRVLRAVLWKMTGSLDKATQWAGHVGMVFGRIIIAIGIAIGIMLEAWVQGLFMSFMGWFLLRTARAAVVHSKVSSRLRGISVDRALEADLPLVDGWDTLEDVVSRVHEEEGKHMALVEEEGEPVGIIGAHEISQVNEAKRAFHVARQVMTPLARLVSIEPSASLLVALRTLEAEGVSRLLVRSGEKFVGVLTREQLRRVLHAS